MQGSVEAALGEVQKIKSDEVAVRVIHTGVGAIVESDIMLAAASTAIVVGFNVRPNAEAKALADREGVDIRTYRVIYQLTEDIEKALVGMLAAGDGRGGARRGRGARALPSSPGSASSPAAWSRAASSSARRGSACCATERSSGMAPSTRCAASRKTSARSRRASSAASCSRATTTTTRATSSSATRRSRSSAPRSASVAGAFHLSQ